MPPTVSDRISALRQRIDVGKECAESGFNGFKARNQAAAATLNIEGIQLASTPDMIGSPLPNLAAMQDAQKTV